MIHCHNFHINFWIWFKNTNHNRQSYKPVLPWDQHCPWYCRVLEQPSALNTQSTWWSYSVIQYWSRNDPTIWIWLSFARSLVYFYAFPEKKVIEKNIYNSLSNKYLNLYHKCNFSAKVNLVNFFPRNEVFINQTTLKMLSNRHILFFK